MDENAVIERTNYLLDLARRKFGPIPPVEISFYNRGTAAGKAYVRFGKFGIKYSSEIISKDINETYSTISHEVAHIVCFAVYKNYTHNRQWKKVCIALGGDGKVCHNVKLTPKRVHMYFQYLLDNGAIIWLAKNRHTKIQKGKEYRAKLGNQLVSKDHYTGKIGNSLTIDRAA